MKRRDLLVATLLGAAGCDSSSPHEGLLGAMERLNDRAQRTLFRRSKLAPEEPESALTPPGSFPAYKLGDAPPEIPSTWALQVKGLVARPLTLSLADLRKLPRTAVRVRHHCVEGWSGVAGWDGVRVSEIARLAGADPRAKFVEFRSFETAPPDEDDDDDEGAPKIYYSSWDRESAEHPQTILAYGMNGSVLPREYGAPVRLYSGVKLGYKLVKWVDTVVFQPVRGGGYWEDQGYEWFAGT